MGSWWTVIWIGVLFVGEAGRRAGSEEAISQLEFRGYRVRKGCWGVVRGWFWLLRGEGGGGWVGRGDSFYRGRRWGVANTDEGMRVG